MMWIWPTSWTWKGKEPENAVVTASSSDGESTQSHALCSGQSGAEAATTSASCPSPSLYFSERIQSLSERRNDFASEVEFEIESSKSHWTEPSVARLNCDSDEEQVPNSVVFEKLKEHPEWGPFFRRQPYVLKIGERIAEGGQAEIYEASRTNVIDHYHGTRPKKTSGWHGDMDLVVKVFKGGSTLQELQQMWPPGLASAALPHLYFPQSHGLCWALGVQLLGDGRFAFVYDRYWGDVRKLIDERVRKSNGTPPFSMVETRLILLNIARGMANLHGLGILHRDLKAANVLIGREGKQNSIIGCPVFIADFESSLRIIGTKFWRSPEVLLALRNGGGSRAVKFTRESDVYSYAMTCYEVITGRLPFEGHPVYDYDVVLRGDRPALPNETPCQLKALVIKCWHKDPLQRPSFQEIVEDLTAMADQLNLDIVPPVNP